MESIISVLKERSNLEISVKAKMLQYLQDWRHIAKSNKKELGFIVEAVEGLSLIHISEPTRPSHISRMPSSA